MFEHTVDIGSNHDDLQRIAQQIAHHAYAAGLRNLDKYGEVGTMLPERRMRGMPDPFPAEDPAARLDFSPIWIKGVTAMTDPLGSKLPGTTMAASLHQKPALT